MTEKYRFDDAYEKVYERHAFSHHFIGTYYAYGINKGMTDAKKTKIIDQDHRERINYTDR